MDYDLPAMIKKKNVLHLGEIHDPEGVKISRIFKLSDLSSSLATSDSA